MGQPSGPSIKGTGGMGRASICDSVGKSTRRRSYEGSSKSLGHRERLHRTLDVYFHEDQWQNRAKVAAANLSLLRKIGGTILSKLDPKTPLIYKMTGLSSSDSFRTRFINFEF